MSTPPSLIFFEGLEENLWTSKPNAETSIYFFIILLIFLRSSFLVILILAGSPLTSLILLGYSLNNWESSATEKFLFDRCNSYRVSKWKPWGVWINLYKFLLLYSGTEFFLVDIILSFIDIAGTTAVLHLILFKTDVIILFDTLGLAASWTKTVLGFICFIAFSPFKTDSCLVFPPYTKGKIFNPSNAFVAKTVWCLLIITKTLSIPAWNKNFITDNLITSSSWILWYCFGSLLFNLCPIPAATIIATTTFFFIIYNFYL